MHFKNLLKVSCFILLCFFVMPAMAQNTTVTGKVTDSKDGSSLPGVSIVAKGTSIGTVTDVNGNFRLSVPSSVTTLTVSFVGYTKKDVPISTGPMNITLDATSTSLNEVLVVGYGTVKKKDATGAVQKVSSGDFVQGVTTNPLQQLQGKAAGVVITTTGGDPNETPTVRIRGYASLSGGQDPLYVIDGVAGADINSVSPNDIESFDILKDASAAAIYGSRAAGGVIIVTTKTGKAGKAVVDFNTYIASESPEKLPDFMNRSQYLSAYQSFYGHPMPTFNPASPSTTSDQGANTNWFKEITRTGFTHNENLGLSGGTDKSHYRVSVTNIDQDGIVRGQQRKNVYGRFNFDQKTLNDKLLITINGSGSHVNTTYVDGSVFLNAAAVPSVVSVYDPLNPGQYQFINNTQEINPVPQLLDITNVGTIDHLVGNLRLDYTVVKGLTLTPYANATRDVSVYNIYYPPTNLVQAIGDHFSYTPTLSGHGDVDKGTQTDGQRTLGATLDYRTMLGNNSIHLLGGYEYNDFESTGVRVGAHDFNDINLPNENINAANGISPNDIASYDAPYKLQSWFGRFDYNYASKYYLTANVRYDWSNKLGLNNQSGVFPSVDLGWVISNEDFMKGISWLSELKLRGGYGEIGNQNAINAYTSQFLFGPTGKLYYDGATGTFRSSSFATQNANPDLRWEVKATTDIGMDFALFNNRLTGTFDVYYSKTKDLLYNYIVTTGGRFFIGNILANIGSLSNKGLELALNYKVINEGDFKWTAGGNINFNRNKLLNLSGNFAGTTLAVNEAVAGSTGGTGISGDISNIEYLKVGYPVGTLLLPVYAGSVNGVQEFYYFNKTTGKRDTTSNITLINTGQDSPDRKFYTTDPKFTYGITNTWTYHNWSLNLFLRGQYGSHGFNEAYMDYTSLPKLGTYAVLADASTYGIKSASEPSSFWLQGTSFLKVQSATLGYDFNIKDSHYIDKLHVYIAGNNLYTFTGYKGVDPELSTNAAIAGSTVGIDPRTIYPRARQISFGINMTLK